VVRNRSWLALLLSCSAGLWAQSVSFTKYPAPLSPGLFEGPTAITTGPDGALWFIYNVGNVIGRITTDGAITDYPVPFFNFFYGSGIAAGPDGALWFTALIIESNGNVGSIGSVTTAGVVSEYPLPISEYPPPVGCDDPQGITVGPDGALWFTCLDSSIGRITTAGVVTEYPLPFGGYTAGGITVGPDGALWFAECCGIPGSIGRIITAGVVTEYVIPSAAPYLRGIAAGPDGALWFTESAAAQNGGTSKIGRINTAGAVTEYVLAANSAPAGITAGPDGALWFTESGAGKIGRITTAGVVTEYALPGGGTPEGITVGPDGALWFADAGGISVWRAAIASPPILVATPTSLSFAYQQGGSQPATQTLAIAASDSSAQPFTAVASTTSGGGWLSVAPTSGTTSANLSVSVNVTGLAVGTYGGGVIVTSQTGYRLYVPVTLTLIQSAAPLVSFTEYIVPTANSWPDAVAPGSDGALWFTEPLGNNIGRITAAGAITEYPLPTPVSSPLSIAAGPDGALWFTEADNQSIGTITTAGVITEYSSVGNPVGITAGPDGALWFTQLSNQIGRITTAGAITEYSVPAFSVPPGSHLFGIAAGPDGALWFTVVGTNYIGRITTLGVVTIYTVPATSSGPIAIIAGPDGALWFTDSNGIGRITTAGAITVYPTVIPMGGPNSITVGPDGALWFTAASNPGMIGRITIGGVITEYAVPLSPVGSLQPESHIYSTGGITTGPDGALWFTEVYANYILRASVSPTQSLVATPTSMTFSYQQGGGLPAPQTLGIAASDGSAQPFTATAGTASGGNWVIPTSATTSANLTVSVNTSGLAVGTYSGSISVTGTQTDSSSLSVPVTLNVTPALPAITGVGSGASFEAGIVPASWMTIFGTNLSPVTDTWGNAIVNGNLPTSLDGVSVNVGGQPAYVEYISPFQINAVAPNVGTGTVSVTVTNPSGTSPAVTTVGQAVQPAFFQWGNYAVATHLDYTYAVKNGAISGVTTVPAKPGEVIILWGTGFGPTTPPAPVGVEAPSGTTYYAAGTVTVAVGGTPAQVYATALSPGYAGLYQVAIQIPTTLANGDYPVVATISGAQSPSGTLITVQQ